jgi:hypothetical protein
LALEVVEAKVLVMTCQKSTSERVLSADEFHQCWGRLWAVTQETKYGHLATAQAAW